MKDVESGQRVGKGRNSVLEKEAGVAMFTRKHGQGLVVVTI